MPIPKVGEGGSAYRRWIIALIVDTGVQCGHRRPGLVPVALHGPRVVVAPRHAILEPHPRPTGVAEILYIYVYVYRHTYNKDW